MTATRQSGFADANPTIVGREREQATLRDTLAAALAGRGSLVLIGGEAGIGKTALAEALLVEAAPQGALVLVGRCYDLAETPPYGPWVELFGRYRPSPADPPHPPAFAQRGTVGAVASQAALVAEVRDWLAALAARQSLVLLLDDLHWADPASLDLLRAAARDLADLPLLILATYRADELTRRHPLYQLLPTLEREARATRLDLRRLDLAALHALVGRYALAEDDAQRLVTWLHARAEGNAFFTTQLLRTLEEEGALRPGADGWRLGDLAATRLPAPLRQVLDARLARLGEEAQRLLTLAAVIGQEVPLALWATVAETDEDALLDAVDAATEAQLVTALPDGSAVLFAHALVREALYEGLVATRRRRVHQRIGEALIATRDPNPDAVADHLRRAGDTRAWDWLEQAGQRAQRAYAWVTATERYEAALVLLEGRADQARQRALLLMTLAQLRRYDQPERGLAALEEAARLVASGDEALVAAIQFDHGHLQCMAGREMQRGLAEMTAALPVLEALPAAERAGLPALVVLGIAPEERYHLGALVLWLSISGRYDDAVRHGAPFARREPGTTARGLSGLAGAYSALGRPDEARRATADARAAFLAAGEHNEVRGTWAGEYEEIVLPYETERRAEQAWLLTEAGRAHARARGTMGDDPATMLDLDITLPTLWLDGHWAEARRRVAASAAPAHPWLPLALIARAQGDAAAAWRPVEAHLPDGPASEPGQTRFHFRFTTLRLAADLALDAGDLPTARAWLAAHDRWLAWSGSVLGRAEGQALWATYHRAAGDPAQAREHAEAALAHASEPRQPLALLVAHRALGELATADARYGDAEQHLAAALALAEACAAPYERALTLLAQAELRAVAGESAGAHTALSETRALLEPLEARPALARADALAATLAATPPTTTSASTLPFGLSAREAEVLRLVAQGLSDAQVAEQLFLSLYTVKAHLRSVYNKTGAPSRTAAAHLAREHGLA